MHRVGISLILAGCVGLEKPPQTGAAASDLPADAPGAQSSMIDPAPPTATLPHDSNGCYADGVHDDRACLQDAIDTHRTVTLAASASYLVAAPLLVPSGVTLDGASSRIFGTAAPLVKVQGSNIKITDVWLDAQMPATDGASLQLFAGSSHVTVENCTFTGDHSLAALYANDAGMSAITFRKNTVDGTVYGVLTDYRALDLNGLEIDANTFDNLTGDGVEINSPVYVSYEGVHGSGTPGVASTNIKITNNTIRAPGSHAVRAGFCIGIAGATHVTIQKNHLQQCKWQGIHLEDTASDITIAGNTLDGTVGAQPGDSADWNGHVDGILLLNTHKIYILNNKINSSTDYGIESSWDGTSFNHNISIAQNTIRGAGQFGILVGALPTQNVQTWIGPVPGYGGNAIYDAVQGKVDRQARLGLTIINNLNF